MVSSSMTWALACGLRAAFRRAPGVRFGGVYGGWRGTSTPAEVGRPLNKRLRGITISPYPRGPESRRRRGHRKREGYSPELRPHGLRSPGGGLSRASGGDKETESV